MYLLCYDNLINSRFKTPDLETIDRWGPHYLGIVSAEPPAAEQHDGGRVRLLLAPTGPH